MANSSSTSTRRKFTPEQVAIIKAEYASGLSMEKLAAKYGVSLGPVRNAILSGGGKARSLSAARGLKPRKMTAQQEAEAERMYVNGKSQDEIGDVFGVTGVWVGMLLKSRGVTARPQGPMEDPILRAKILREYAEGKPQTHLTKEYGTTCGAITAAAQEEGIHVRTISEAGRKYHRNDDFFEVINTEAKAYILGFATADSCISGRTFQTILAVADKGHLEKIAVAMEYDGPILDGLQSKRRKDGGPLYKATLAIRSEKLTSDLIRLGVRPDKTHSVKPWNGPAHLLPAYYRGMFDGDGSISKHNVKSYGQAFRWAIQFCGNAYMVTGLANFIADRTGIVKTPYWRGYQWGLAYCNLKDNKTITRLLYDGATIYLDRKKALADEILRVERMVQDRSDLTAEQLRQAFNRLGSWKLVAAELGTTIGNLATMRSRLGIRRHEWQVVQCSAVTTDALVKAVSEAGSWTGAAAKLGVCRQMLQKHARRLGVDVSEYLR